MTIHPTVQHVVLVIGLHHPIDLGCGESHTAWVLLGPVATAQRVTSLQDWPKSLEIQGIIIFELNQINLYNQYM